MENAAKALLIAGGVLIALILISMFLLMRGRISSMSQAHEENRKQEQLVKFNAEYEAFNKALMYGVDVITLFNKATQNNLDHPGSSMDRITIYLDNEVLTNTSGIEFKYVYRCVDISYNEAGRVSSLNIETYSH